MAAAGMAQPGLAGGSNAGGGLNNRTVSGSSETPSTPQHDEIKEVQAMKSSELQRAGREEPMYGPLPRPHGLTSPANSLGTESLVTPITTPEPSGSPRGTLEPSIEAGLQARPVPSPLVQNTYDRYMPTLPMVMPQYMTTYAGYYSQPAVYVVHSGAAMPPSQAGFGLQPVHPMQAHAGHHYLPHPLEQVHHPVPYDFSVPPPNFTYVPMHPPPHPPPLMTAHPPPPYNMAAPAVYKISDRFVPVEGGPQMGPGDRLHHEPRALHSMPSNELIVEPCEQLDEVIQDPSSIDPQQYAEHLQDSDVAEVTEIIEEIHLYDRAESYQTGGSEEGGQVGEHMRATPNEEERGRTSSKSWYDECTSHEQKLADDGVATENHGAVNQQVVPQQSTVDQPTTSGSVKPVDRREYSGVSHQNYPRQYDIDGRGDGHPRRREQRRNSRNGRQPDSRDSTRERPNASYDNHGRRSLTPEKRYRGNYGGGGPSPRDDRRYSNPEHSANHLRAPRRPRGGYDQAPSRESSAGRRENTPNGNSMNGNRQRYYPSPKRDGRDYRYENHGNRRYDGNLRRGGSGVYRPQWRDDGHYHGGRDELMKPIPRTGHAMNMNNNNNNANSRKPPLPRQDSGQSSSACQLTNGTVSPVVNGVTKENSTTPVPVENLNNKPKENAETEDASYLEFLGPSFLGLNERVDVEGLLRRSHPNAVQIGSSISHCGDQVNGNYSKNNINNNNNNCSSTRRGGSVNARQGRKEHE